MDGFVHFRCTNLKHKLPSTPFMLYISAVRKSNSMKHHAKNYNWKSLVYKISPLLINNLNRIHKQMDCLFIVTIPKQAGWRGICSAPSPRWKYHAGTFSSSCSSTAKLFQLWAQSAQLFWTGNRHWEIFIEVAKDTCWKIVYCRLVALVKINLILNMLTHVSVLHGCHKAGRLKKRIIF